MVLGLIVGCAVGGLRRGQGWLKAKAEVARAQRERQTSEVEGGEEARKAV